MRLRGIVFEDFINYKKPSMFLITSTCNWKCCIESGMPISVCQNSELMKSDIKEYSSESIYRAYILNPISQAIVLGGLEPMEQFSDILELIKIFRINYCNDPFVIYTGFYPSEIEYEIIELKKYLNIIIKFGRYIPGRESIYDSVLGVTLSSDNQYAVQIS